jgi:hypothetical protein
MQPGAVTLQGQSDMNIAVIINYISDTESNRKTHLGGSFVSL